MRNLCLLIICFSFSSCLRTYKETRKVCGDNLYLEVFNRYPDCADYYLTDSISFRTFFVSQDLEHEYLRYECEGGIIYLMMIESSSKNCRNYIDENGNSIFKCDPDTVLKRAVFVNQLKRQHRFE